MLSRITENISCCSLDNGNLLREVTVKIGLERINIQAGVTTKVLLDSGVIELVMSSEFTGKQIFKLDKIERSIYVRNVNSFFNKEESIEYMMEVIIYYQGYRERSVILEIP